MAASMGTGSSPRFRRFPVAVSGCAPGRCTRRWTDCARMGFGLSRAPRPVRDAVRLMGAGAVLTLAALVTVLVTLGGVRSAAAHDLTGGQWPAVMFTQVGFWLASAPIGAGVWLWLAWA